MGMEKVIELLNDNTVCCIATCRGNIPRATTMEYVMVNGSLLFSTVGNSHKDKNLKENNRISIAVNNFPVYVTIDGTTESPSADEIQECNKLYYERHPELIEELRSITLCYYKLIPVVAYYNDYSQDIASEIINA